MQNFFSFPKLGKQEFLHAGKFVLLLLTSFMAINFFVSFFPLEFFENIFAWPTVFLLGLLGINSSILAGEPVKIIAQGIELPIAITFLCTGLLEWSILCSAIIASTEINAKKRAIGITAATIAVYAFNLFRINASILLIFLLGLKIASLGHDILFRVFLFISIAGFYFIWIKTSTSQKKMFYAFT